ncbi:hypothetical protein AFR78_14690 [Listeria monocytogenes]|uniref:hypothetical protein n=1 Tax=Listeria monocytogenes TaxID=1639 RepID=UPI00087573C6|nr:hypothetical protein [Listeria monocytogenes]EAD9920898.1 hypothetical protein [Listeria monocytogenes]EAD9923872.1 hypothetical protein [Listeria monocytogenes]OFG75319.1 hypothetical protein BJM70_00165 [Listeria monocytogenes]
MSENKIDSVVEELLVKAVEENPTLNIRNANKGALTALSKISSAIKSDGFEKSLRISGDAVTLIKLEKDINDLTKHKAVLGKGKGFYENEWHLDVPFVEKGKETSFKDHSNFIDTRNSQIQR